MSSSALIADLERQFSENPRRVFARLANEYRKSGDAARAIEVCRAHVPQQPGYISGHVVLGQALYDDGQYAEARSAFETALTLDPENLIALRSLGDIARHDGDLATARSWYTRLLDVDPHNPEVVAQLATLGASRAEQMPATPAAEAVPDAMPEAMPDELEKPARTERREAALPVDDIPAEWAGENRVSFDGASRSASAPATPAESDAVAEYEPLDIAIGEGELAFGGELAVPESAPAAEPADDDVELPFLIPDELGEAPAAPVFPSAEHAGPEAGAPERRDAEGAHADDEEPLLELDDASAESAESPVADAPAPVSEQVVDEPEWLRPEEYAGTADVAEPIEEAAAEAPVAFVTETMAELYLSQGFREEALDIYRRLMEQHPNDHALHERAARLESEIEAAAAEPAPQHPRHDWDSDLSFAAALGFDNAIDITRDGGAGGSPVAPAPEARPAERRSAGPRSREFFAGFATRRPLPPRDGGSSGPAGGTTALAQGASSHGIGALLAEAPGVPEDAAASRLAAGFSEEPVEEGALPGQPSRVAPDHFSLDHIFNAPSEPAKPAGYSFDDFFGENGSGAPAGEQTTPESAGNGGESADLEAFNAWLEGLKR